MQALDHYAALVQSSDDAIIAKDLDSRVISWNPAAERIFGFTAEEMIGQSLRRLIPDDRQREEDEILARIRSGQLVGQFFTERLHKAGHLVQVAVTVSPVKDASGAIVGASKIARDASAHVAMLDRLRTSERRFRLLADNIPQCVWTADPSGRIYWLNSRWEQYTGQTIENVGDPGYWSVIHPDHLDRLKGSFSQSLATGEDWEEIYPIRASDGEYNWFLSRAIPIRDENGVITDWFGSNTDITEQREQAEHIRLLLDEVNHRSKNMLMKVRAIAGRTAGATPDFLERFDQRLQSMAVNQDVVVRQGWQEVPVAELATAQLRFLGEGQRQVIREGPAVALNSRAAEVLGMALYELATNSLKYGSLSVPEGKVALEWQADPETGRFAMVWRETGGPALSQPEKTGFGTTLIRDVPRQGLQATVSLDYPPGGVIWKLESFHALATRQSGGQSKGRDLSRV